jgi:hypothetical protein
MQKYKYLHDVCLDLAQWKIGDWVDVIQDSKEDTKYFRDSVNALFKVAGLNQRISCINYTNDKGTDLTRIMVTDLFDESLTDVPVTQKPLKTLTTDNGRVIQTSMFDPILPLAVRRNKMIKALGKLDSGDMVRIRLDKFDVNAVLAVVNKFGRYAEIEFGKRLLNRRVWIKGKPYCLVIVSKSDVR